MKRFDGSESADHGPIAKRRDSYSADGVTVYDDRTICCHYGQCTERLPGVFGADAEPFVDAEGASAAEIIDVVRGCPSGALSYARGSDAEPVEPDEPASITATVDGPYRVRGSIRVFGADGRAMSPRAPGPVSVRALAKQTVLRRLALVRRLPRSAAARAGQAAPDALRGGRWDRGAGTTHDPLYDAILSEPDPLLEPVFRGMDANHPKHVAAWLAETFGGPQTYSLEHGGYEHMLAKHRNLSLTEEQRKRWIARMSETADEVGLPADPNLRSTLVAYLSGALG